MNKIKLWQLITFTFVILYAIIGFVTWELDWIKHLPDYNNWDRFWFFFGIVVKIILDVMLFRYLNEEPRDKQKELDKQAESYVDKRGLEESKPA